MTEFKVEIPADETYIACREVGEPEPELDMLTIQQGVAIDDRCLSLTFNVRDEDGSVREAGCWLTRTQAEDLARILRVASIKLPASKEEVSVVRS